MKAVVFCHFHHKSAVYDRQKRQQLTAQGKREIIDSVSSYYKAFLKCRNISLVYVYVDTGIRQILDHLFQGGGKINIDINELAFEHTVRNILKLAVDDARSELEADSDFDPAAAPKFQFIGLPHLATLIASLYRRKRDLVKNLAGRGGFTYDAPKFVEAVIRLTRGKDLALGGDPILRFDQDVQVNQEGVEALLNKIRKAVVRGYHYSFFSGGYGSSGESDPVNDYAVRCHWLADVTKQQNEPPFRLIPNGEHFLRDIGEFGATSIPNFLGTSPSVAMKDYIVRQGGRRANRDSKQVISGAGLYMSYSAINRLPPFMNFENNIVWVDDYLKRRLHEVIGDLATTDLESVQESLFHQDRYPDGIEPKDIQWAESIYFYRLISGCIMHALIVERTGEPGPLATFVADFLDNRQLKKNREFAKLSVDFMKVAKITALELLEIWASADYGNDILQKWAQKNRAKLKQGTGELAEWINSTVGDAVNYCKLVENWQDYVIAINDLADHDAYWLFRPVG